MENTKNDDDRVRHAGIDSRLLALPDYYYRICKRPTCCARVPLVLEMQSFAWKNDHVIISVSTKNAKLNHLNFHPLEVVSRYCNPKLWVSENYWYLFDLRQTSANVDAIYASVVFELFKGNLIWCKPIITCWWCDMGRFFCAQIGNNGYTEDSLMYPAVMRITIVYLCLSQGTGDIRSTMLLDIE